MIYKDREEFLKLINELNLKIGCEIGVYKGDYSIKILEKTNLSKLYLIDSWQHLDNYNDISNHSNPEFDFILQGVKNKISNHKERVEIIKGLSENIVNNFEDDYFDFLYLDADHSYSASKKDVSLWYSKVKPGGIFSGHDYLNGSLPQGEFGVKQSIDEFVKQNNLELHVTGEDQWKSWFIIKPNKLDTVIYCTENYYETSVNLINTLNLFHDNLNIHLYEINFNKNPHINNVNIINLEDKRIGDIQFEGDRNNMNNHNMFRAIFLKSKVILHSIKELKLKKVLYLDADILPNSKLDLLFEKFKDITNYPLIQKGPAEYIFFTDFNPDSTIKGIRGNPYENGYFEPTKILEYPICQQLGIPIENRICYANASIVLYNSNCLEFIEEYDKINESTFNLSLDEIRHYYPFADETTINILLWKYKYNNRLPFVQVNINNIDEVKEFYYSYYNEEKIYSTFTKIPSDLEKPNKYIFHGVKNKTSKETSDFIKNFYFNNKNFNIRCNLDENRTYIYCNSKLKVKVNLYEWNSYYDSNTLLYSTLSFFNNNELWYSTTNLNNIKGLKVEITYDNVILKEQHFNFKNIHNQKIKKQVLVLHSQVGIGDNLSATPTIKKMSEIYNQKVTILTYIPSAFINNPYIDQIIPINNNLDQLLNSFNIQNFDIHHLFNLIGTNWRLIDHKQICAYNCGFQLKSNELDMEFYPDEFEKIENLPENFICINPSETEPERTWGYKNWQDFIDLIQEHIPVVAIGKETFLDVNLNKKFSNIQIKNGLNLLNNPCQNTISQAYHIISKSKTFVTMNNGLYILSLCNLDNHITELSTSWNTYFYRIRKGVENYNLDYVRGECKVECLANPKICIDQSCTTQILKSGICYLNKPTYECHPTPEQVCNSILKSLNIK